MEVKTLLYSVIESMGKEKIRLDVNIDIRSSKKYIDTILSKCISRIDSDTDDATLASLSEALLHFMLTTCTFPSQRKIQINDAMLDIVIPNIRVLKQDPHKSIIIQVTDNNNANDKIRQAQLVQPVNQNIWIISLKPLYINFKNYSIKPSNSTQNFSKILLDIALFLEETGDKSFKLLYF